MARPWTALRLGLSIGLFENLRRLEASRNRKLGERYATIEAVKSLDFLIKLEYQRRRELFLCVWWHRVWHRKLVLIGVVYRLIRNNSFEMKNTRLLLARWLDRELCTVGIRWELRVLFIMIHLLINFPMARDYRFTLA